MATGILNHPNANSARVAIDEIFDDGFARILKAPRDPEADDNDLGIETWLEETEELMKVWRVEAFVGFKAKQSLKEGDVFFVKDSAIMNDKYKPIARDIASVEHLLLPTEESTGKARKEIKKESSRLFAHKNTTKKSLEKALKQVEKKFKTDDKLDSPEKEQENG